MKLSERYPVGIYAVREKTTLLVPTVGIKCASHEARKLPWPPQAEELGTAVLELLADLEAGRVQYDPEAKGYWFQPGIRSWKAFQAASSSVDVTRRGTELWITRLDGRSERGFVPELEPCTVLRDGIGPRELGEAILAVLLPLVEKERGLPLKT